MERVGGSPIDRLPIDRDIDRILYISIVERISLEFVRV